MGKSKFALWLVAFFKAHTVRIMGGTQKEVDQVWLRDYYGLSNKTTKKILNESLLKK